MPRKQDVSPKPNGTLGIPGSVPHGKKKRMNASRTSELGIKSSKRLNRTMEPSQVGQFVRSPLFAERQMTPRRSTRSVVKSTETPSVEMPPPNSVSSTVSKRRKTATAASTVKMVTAVIVESSGTNDGIAPMSSRKHRAAKSLVLFGQSDTDEPTDEDSSIAKPKHRSRNSRAGKADHENPINGNYLGESDHVKEHITEVSSAAKGKHDIADDCVVDPVVEPPAEKQSKIGRKRRNKKNYVCSINVAPTSSSDSEYNTADQSADGDSKSRREAQNLDTEPNNLTDDIDPEHRNEHNVTDDLDNEEAVLIQTSDSEAKTNDVVAPSVENGSSVVAAVANATATSADGAEPEIEPMENGSASKSSSSYGHEFSGINLLPSEDAVPDKCNEIATIDLTDSPSVEHVLNVTFSPIRSASEVSIADNVVEPKQTRISSTPKPSVSGLITGSSKNLSTGKKPMKRLSNNTPRAESKEASAVSSRSSKGTPYVRKVSRSNMPSISNTTILSSAKKEKLLNSVKDMLPPKRVTFNTPSHPISSVKVTAKLKTPVGKNLTIASNESTSITKRTIPDFKTLHRKMFEEMESIDETVQRHNERSKLLSGKKINQSTTTLSHLQKPKPVVRKLASAVPVVVKRAESSKILVNKEEASTASDHLPKPKSVAKRNESTVAVANETQRPKSDKKENRAPDASNHMFKPVPLIRKLNNTVSGANGVAKVPDLKHIVSTTNGRDNYNQTTQSRSERHRRMFKGRDLPVARAVRDREVLKGVRLNKRFELQMKFRDQKE